MAYKPPGKSTVLYDSGSLVRQRNGYVLPLFQIKSTVNFNVSFGLTVDLLRVSICLCCTNYKMSCFNILTAMYCTLHKSHLVLAYWARI